MRALLLLAAALGLAGCAVSTDTGSDNGSALPDARDLAESPLEITKLPQP
ncbi:MAG: hypothetical protein KGR46_07245 [Verrucomicrobia bacterium]|nr:hypothetical protein [Verrucomicrobiota bacterium]